MGQIVEAAAQFPTLILTSALVVTLGFWLLVLLGRTHARAFDADCPSLTRALGGVPVAVAASVVIVSAWLVSITGTVLMESAGFTGFGGAVARIALLALSALIAWSVAHALLVPLARLFPDEPGSRRRDVASDTPFDPGGRRARR